MVSDFCKDAALKASDSSQIIIRGRMKKSISLKLSMMIKALIYL